MSEQQRPSGNPGAEPRIAVLVPCFNDGRYILETLDSIREPEPIQVIVVDDQSTDPATRALPPNSKRAAALAEAFINVLGGALTLAIFLRVIQSWIPTMRLPWGIGALAWGVTEPILGPIRRALPTAAGMDFSPLVALIVIQFVQSILLRLLPQAV